MNYTSLPLICLAALAVLVNPLRGSSLVTYTDFEPETGEEPVTEPTTVHSALDSTDLAIIPEGNLTVGNVHSETWEAPLPYLQARGGWDAVDPASAKAFTFTLSVDDNVTFSLTELRFEDRATGAGPSGATVSINGTTVFEKDVADGSTEVNVVDVSGLGLDDLSSAEVVFAGWDNGSRQTSGGGDWRTAGYELDGTVTVIPEPAALTLLGGLAALAAAARRTKRRSPVAESGRDSPP